MGINDSVIGTVTHMEEVLSTPLIRAWRLSASRRGEGPRRRIPQQLFTENTLTPVLPLFHRKDWAALSNVARLWIIVLLSNIIPAVIGNGIAGVALVAVVH